jgi:hypothetical protein
MQTAESVRINQTNALSNRDLNEVVFRMCDLKIKNLSALLPKRKFIIFRIPDIVKGRKVVKKEAMFYIRKKLEFRDYVVIFLPKFNMLVHWISDSDGIGSETLEYNIKPLRCILKKM